MAHGTRPRTHGFTLVELLVVVAVIALLIGILVPALGGARREAQRLVISNNMRSIATAANAYGSTSGVLPPSYVYGSKETGAAWKIADQSLSGNPTPTNGYVHWSYAIMGEDTEESEAFESPLVTNGGAPRTNPGPDINNWEPSWQTDDTSSSTPQDLPKDRQARRVAFGGNHAIFPRNKFAGTTGGESQRKNILVNPAVIKAPARVILATEFIDLGNWQSITEGENPNLCKSHRPLTPFRGTSAATVYGEIDAGGRRLRQFTYPSLKELTSYDELRLSGSDIKSQLGSQGVDFTAIGREHPGGNSTDGGTTYFVFLDGHVEKMLLKDTLVNGLWGDRFYSLSGSNTLVANPNEPK